MAVYIDIEEYDKALEIFDRAEKISPDHWYMQLNLGRLHYLTGNFEEAEKAIRKSYAKIKIMTNEDESRSVEIDLVNY